MRTFKQFLNESIINETQKFVMCIYSEEDDGMEPETSYFKDKNLAISTAMKQVKHLEDGQYIEVWKADKDGTFGNSGEPLYKSDI